MTSFAVGSDVGVKEEGSQGYCSQECREIGGGNVRERHCGGEHRPQEGSCRPWEGLTFLFGVVEALGGF